MVLHPKQQLRVRDRLSDCLEYYRQRFVISFSLYRVRLGFIGFGAYEVYDLGVLVLLSRFDLQRCKRWLAAAVL